MHDGNCYSQARGLMLPSRSNPISSSFFSLTFPTCVTTGKTVQSMSVKHSGWIGQKSKWLPISTSPSRNDVKNAQIISCCVPLLSRMMAETMVHWWLKVCILLLRFRCVLLRSPRPCIVVLLDWQSVFRISAILYWYSSKWSRSLSLHSCINMDWYDQFRRSVMVNSARCLSYCRTLWADYMVSSFRSCCRPCCPVLCYA